MKKLYIDLDGVMLNTIKTSVKMMQELNVDTKDFASVDEFYSKVDWDDLISKSGFIENSVENLKMIEDTEEFDITFLSHVKSLKEITIKKNFLREHFVDVPLIGVPHSMPKAEMVNPKDAILVDDYTINVETWIEAGGIGIKFSETHKDRDYPVIDSLDKILDMEW